MAERETRRVAQSLVEDSHIAGRRINVCQVYALREERGVDSEPVTERGDQDVADVYHRRADWHDLPAELTEVETEREEAMEAFRTSFDRGDGVEPDTA